MQQFRESLEAQGRDFSEDELKAVKEGWADIVKRAEEQPEQTTSDPIMLTDLDPYLIPLHDPQHHTHILSLTTMSNSASLWSSPDADDFEGP